MKFILLLVPLLAFSGLEPKTVLLEMADEPVGYLAQTGKERCKDDYAKVQERANAICYSKFHLYAVELGYETTESDREPLLSVSKYDTKLMAPKLYKCKKDRRHPSWISHIRFSKIMCVTL